MRWLLVLAAFWVTSIYAEDFELGQALFNEHCVTCHGRYGEGDGPVAKVLSVNVPDLTRITSRRGEFSVKDLTRIIDGRVSMAAHGDRYMPIWGWEFRNPKGVTQRSGVTAKDKINALVEYLNSIQKEPEDESAD